MNVIDTSFVLIESNYGILFVYSLCDQGKGFIGTSKDNNVTILICVGKKITNIWVEG